MKRHLSSYEWRCLLFVLRKTYGWNKKEDWISLSQFVEATEIQRPHVCRALKMLSKQNIITKGGTITQPLYSFQKYSSKWTALPKGARSHHITKGGNEVLPKGVIGVVPKGAHTKETITKETIQKKEYIPITELNDLHFQQIADRYSVPISFVRSKYDDMVNWHESTGKKKKDWIATLRNFVKNDSLKLRKDAYGKSNIAFIETQ